MKKQNLRSACPLTVVRAGALALAAGGALLGKPGAVGAAEPSPFASIRNVILFIGDGMGPNHVQVGRMLNGGALRIDGIPWDGVGTLDTTSLDGVTDSAAGGTALATGQETLNGWVSMVPADYANGDLTPVAVETALERAEQSRKATGLVTDLELSDATPAVFAAHVPDRGLGAEITEQMAARGIEVLFSGGWSESYLLGAPDVTSLRELEPYLTGAAPWPTKMYGIFGKTSLAYTIDREEEGATRKQPTLPQLTQAAIGVLSKDPDGFFLMVEGGANDDLKRLLQRGDGHLFFTLFPPPAEFPATPDGIAAFRKMMENAPQVSMVSDVGRLAPLPAAAPFQVEALSFALCPMFSHVLFTAVGTLNDRMTLHVNFDAARLPPEQALPIIADLENALIRAID